MANGTKKRPRVSPGKIISKQTRTENYWLNSPTTTSNRFEMLYSEQNENISNNEADKTSNDKVIKPNPIFIQGV
jgi:hypothetical protein